MIYFLVFRKDTYINPSLYEYNKFLKVFLHTPKKDNIRHFQQYNRNLEGMCLINKDGEHTPGYGASSHQYIVSKGVKYTFPNGYGHDTIYFLEDYTVVGHSLYLYKDTYGYDYFFDQVEKNQVVYSWTRFGYYKLLVSEFSKRKGTVIHSRGVSNWDGLLVDLPQDEKILEDFVGNSLIVKNRDRIIDSILDS